MDTFTAPRASLPDRRVRFEYPEDFNAKWQPRKPEFAAACNALSLGMPYGEPYVVASVRAVLDDLDDPELVAQARSYLTQEREHHRQHKRFNEVVTAQQPGLLRIERWLQWTYRTLARRSSREFNLAFAAGFEAVAFSSARWADKHRHELFTGADGVASTLFLWHLAEEVEHKSVAFDVWNAIDGNRWRYLRAMFTSFVMLAGFVLIGTLAQLFRSGRILNPVAWFRLIKWAFSLAFEVMPTMAITALPGHHPNDLADPVWLTDWLREFDPATGSMPLWDESYEAEMASPTGL